MCGSGRRKSDLLAAVVMTVALSRLCKGWREKTDLSLVPWFGFNSSAQRGVGLPYYPRGWLFKRVRGCTL